jgi:hypothetical protein
LDYSIFAFIFFFLMIRKSTHTREYRAFRDLLIESRQRAGLTQLRVGEKLPFEQPSVSKMERASAEGMVQPDPHDRIC